MGVITVDLAVWGLLVANILPLVVAFVTNEVTKKGVREALLAILSGVVVWATDVLEAGSFDVKASLIQFAALFIASVSMYFGWQRNTIAPPLQKSGLSVGAPK
jgi:hypothetical protein